MEYRIGRGDRRVMLKLGHSTMSNFTGEVTTAFIVFASTVLYALYANPLTYLLAAIAWISGIYCAEVALQWGLFHARTLKSFWGAFTGNLASFSSVACFIVLLLRRLDIVTAAAWASLLWVGLVLALVGLIESEIDTARGKDMEEKSQNSKKGDFIRLIVSLALLVLGLAMRMLGEPVVSIFGSPVLALGLSSAARALAKIKNSMLLGGVAAAFPVVTVTALLASSVRGTHAVLSLASGLVLSLFLNTLCYAFLCSILTWLKMLDGGHYEEPTGRFSP